MSPLINTSESPAVKQNHDVIFLIGVMAILFVAVIFYLIISNVAGVELNLPLEQENKLVVVEETV